MGFDLVLETFERTRPDDDAPDEEVQAWLNTPYPPDGSFHVTSWAMPKCCEIMDTAKMLDHSAPPQGLTDAGLEWAPKRPSGILVYKLRSNNGWLVTPLEIEAALSKAAGALVPDDWREPREGGAPILSATLSGTSGLWDKWIRWLDLASRSEGFRVW
jgi:hypothetical protein